LVRGRLNDLVGRIVVGSDGSASALAAIEWAAGEAERRGSSLHVVAHQTRELVLEAAVGADLLVVDAANLQQLLRSTSSAGARRSSCPVIVVRGRVEQPLRRIVVGVDGSNASANALDWAVDEACFHDAELVIVHAWPPTGGGDHSTRSDDLDRSDAQCSVDVSVRHCEKRMERRVSGELIEGDPGVVLTAMSTGADLIAVGSRGRSGFTTLLLGSVAVTVSDCARCPVAIIHPRNRVAQPGRLDSGRGHQRVAYGSSIDYRR